jgi:hypothetical protein
MRPWRFPGGVLSLTLIVGLMVVLSGCDASGGQKAEYKPIETDILKKLGAASQAQSDAARAEHPSARTKKKR